MNEIVQLLNQYGYIILFLSLMVELIIIPVPNEALMSYVGILCFQGKMNLFLSIAFAGLGGISGATISYWIGRKLGVPFFQKYGHFIHMGPEKMEKTSKWYRKYGKVLLLFSFFIPGVRHVASIISGVIKLPFKSFSFFSYIGVFLWVGAFISLGNLLGPKWDQYQGEIKKWLVLASIVIGFLAILFFIFKKNKEYIKESFLLLNEAAFKRFRSFLKIKIMILTVFILFVTFLSLMAGMIQDLVANEYGRFNLITKAIIFSMLNQQWNWVVKTGLSLSSMTVLTIIVLLTVVVIFISKTNKMLELVFFLSTLAGAYLFSIGMRWVFHFMLSQRSISSDFPDIQSILVMAVYGFFFFISIRHHRRYFLSIGLFILLLTVLAAFFVSEVFINNRNPSDLAAGFVFSAVWLTGMTFSMEMFRLLSIIKNNNINL